MISTRAKRLRALLAGLGVAVAGFCSPPLRAQGFGTDPFRPYNSQFDPYVYPIGPPIPDARQAAAALSRGIGGANQFQQYLDQLQGITRSEIERYSIGLPYYQRAIDPAFDREGKRLYRPNRQSERVFQDTQQLITEKYLAYFAERDPAQRVMLLRDYNRTRRNVGRALASVRAQNPSATLERAAGFGAGGTTSRATGGRSALDQPADRGATRNAPDLDRAGSAPPVRGRAGGSSATRRSDVIPPAPAVGPRAGRRGRRSADPDAALDRARRLRDLSPRLTRPEIDRGATPEEPPATSRDE
jgi:hypothetical protein